jgi:hypothetical protein
VEVEEREITLLLNFQFLKEEQVIHLQQVLLKEIMVEMVLMVFRVAEEEAEAEAEQPQ